MYEVVFDPETIDFVKKAEKLVAKRISAREPRSRHRYGERQEKIMGKL